MAKKQHGVRTVGARKKMTITKGAEVSSNANPINPGMRRGVQTHSRRGNG